MKKLPIINFDKNAPGRYWYLFWVGKVIYEDGDFQIMFHFINSMRNDDEIKGYNNSYRETHTLSINTLYFLSIGTIYDTSKNQIIAPSNYYKNYRNVSIFAKSNYNSTDKPFPFLSSKYTPLNFDINFKGLEYFKFKGKDKFKPDIKVILPITTLCCYLYFKSSRLISFLLRYTIEDLFATQEKKIIHENDVKIGYLKYNNLILDKSEAMALAPFLFMYNNSGANSLKALGNRLKNYFNQNRNNAERIQDGAYLSTDWPFNHDINLVLQGKEFNVDGVSYFMAYRIINFNTKVDNLYTVDEVIVEKLHPKNSTKERDFLNKKKVISSSSPKIQDVEITLENVKGNSSVPIQKKIIETDSFFNYLITVKEITRDTQDKAYDVNTIPSSEAFSKATLNILEADPDSDHIRQVFDSIYKKHIGRFEFIRMALSKLKNEFNIPYKFDILDKSISSDKTYSFLNNEVMAVELKYKEQYFYMVEFEKGHTGFIHDINLTPIVPLYLEAFISKCLIQLTELNTNEYLWTAIQKKKYYYEGRFGIVVSMSLTHQVKGFQTNDEIAFKMAEKIFKDRILKIAS